MVVAVHGLRKEYCIYSKFSKFINVFEQTLIWQVTNNLN